MQALHITVPKEQPSFREGLSAIPFALKLVYDASPFNFIVQTVAAVSSAPIMAAQVFGIKGLSDALIAGEPRELWKWGALLLCATACGSIRDIFSERSIDFLRYAVEATIKERTLVHSARLPFYVIENPAFRQLADAYRRKQYVILNLVQWSSYGLTQLSIVFGIGTIVLFLPWYATLLLVFAFGMRIVLSAWESKWEWSLFQFETREGRRAQYVESVIDQPIPLFTAKALELPDTFIGRWKQFTHTLLARRKRIENQITGTYVGLESLYLVGLASGLLSTLRDPLLYSTAIVFVTNYQRLWQSLGNFSWNFRSLIREVGFLSVIRAYFSIPEEVDKGKPLPKESLTIRFEGVWFRYPGSTEDILRGVDFTIQEGDHIALAGLNGAGKSTFLKLLTGIYEPTRGKITVNGIELARIRPSAWRGALAMMSQDQVRFDDTIREQIRYGDLSVKERKDRMDAAMHVSSFNAVLPDFKQGLETHVGKQYAMPEDQAVEMSGGQNQLLAIARTLYRNARLYVFDEPTSAVDAEKEERFFGAIPESLRGKAVIFVSHRFSTLRRAERIIVLDQGRVIEDGTHEALIAKKGRYAELFTLQAKMYQ